MKNLSCWCFILATALIILALGIADHLEAQDVHSERHHYCEMVAIWEIDANRGIPPEDRAGWPPYDGEC